MKIDEEDNNEDEEKNPNKVVIITPYTEEIFFLSNYESVFTNRNVLWAQIQEIFSLYKQEVIVPSDETFTLPNT
jgi:hypothetical protein